MTLAARSPVSSRVPSTLAQTVKAAESIRALAVDPLLPLVRAIPLLGDPSYSLVRKWISDGHLKVWRLPGGRGQFRVRLSEIQRFRREYEEHYVEK